MSGTARPSVPDWPPRALEGIFTIHQVRVGFSGRIARLSFLSGGRRPRMAGRPGTEDCMVARGRFAVRLGMRSVLWLALLSAGTGCGTTSDLVRTAWRKGDDQVRLPEAEQMIDELDRILTMTG